jgi:hypothetical protein
MNQVEVTKKCSKCQEVKPITNFYFSKTTHKYRGLCISCCKLNNNIYSDKHKEVINKRAKVYFLLHREQIRLKKVDFNFKHREIRRIKQKQYVETHKEEYRTYQNTRRSSNINAKLTHNLSSRMRLALLNKQKSGHTLELLCCNIDQLKRHIEKQFKDGMSWDNYTHKGWHIDHIIPCSYFDLSDPTEQKLAYHYGNLQPMWSKDNLEKQAKILDVNFIY